MLCTAHWKCNWTYAVDNVMDLIRYIRTAVSHSMAEGDTEAKMQIEPTDTGFIFEKSDQRDVNFDWINMVILALFKRCFRFHIGRKQARAVILE